MLGGKFGVLGDEPGERLLALTQHRELRRLLPAGEVERLRGLLDPQRVVLVLQDLGSASR
jgi:hypothetical protein